jgi:hypothetical protein
VTSIQSEFGTFFWVFSFTGHLNKIHKRRKAVFSFHSTEKKNTFLASHKNMLVVVVVSKKENVKSHSKERKKQKVIASRRNFTRSFRERRGSLTMKVIWK